MKEEKTIKYEDINKKSEPPIVYVIQEIPGTKEGRPKITLWVPPTMENLNFYYLNYLK